MKDLFISHAEQDGRLTKELASGLEKRGFTTWYYERDSVPGLSYLLQTAQAIRESKVVVLIISKSSLCSNQVTKEVVRAHEENKPFLPILFKLSHVQFQSKQDEWREALGSAASISVSRCGISDILPRIEQGLQALRIMPASTCSSGLQGADRFTLMKTHVSSRAGTPAKNVKPYNALQKAKSSRKPAGVNRQEVTIFAQDPVEPSLPSADSQLLHESECVYSKQCLVNLASLGLTKASLLELVQGEFRSHMNYFRFDLENYPLPLRSGFVAYINKTGKRLEFTGLVKCSANEVKLASWNDILTLYRRSTRLAYRSDPRRVLLFEGTLQRVTDLHLDLRVRISKHFTTLEDLQVEGWMTGFGVEPGKGTSFREEMTNLIVYHLRESAKADHEAFKIEELFRMEDMTLQDATGDVVMSLELSLQHIHKVITAFPPIS